jgi:hypothetical protein
MKLTIIILSVLHAFIHLLGFVKGFGLAEIKELSLPISRNWGILWLAAFLLLVAAALFLLLKLRYWWFFMFAGILLSQLLVICFWGDARWGTIPNVILLIASLIVFSSQVFTRKIESERAEMLQNSLPHNFEKISPEKLNSLPVPVKNWLANCGITGKENISTVLLTQKAKMKLKPEQTNWFDAEAEQYFTTEPAAFNWTVNLKMNPFIKIRGRDKFEDGKGEMRIKMNSLINIVNEKGAKIDEGSLQRFLGEIVWFPSAALHPNISWEEIDPLSARATLKIGETKGSGTFHFNKNGDLEKFTALRYKGNEPDAHRHEWIIAVKEISEMSGIRIPTKMESTWMLNSGPWTWLILEITDIHYNTTPFGKPLDN